MAGRAILAPVSAQIACILPIAVLAGVVVALAKVSSGAPVGALFVNVALFLVDQWYVFGARKLGLLPSASVE